MFLSFLSKIHIISFKPCPETYRVKIFSLQNDSRAPVHFDWLMLRRRRRRLYAYIVQTKLFHNLSSKRASLASTYHIHCCHQEMSITYSVQIWFCTCTTMHLTLTIHTRWLYVGKAVKRIHSIRKKKIFKE